MHKWRNSPYKLNNEHVSISYRNPCVTYQNDTIFNNITAKLCINIVSMFKFFPSATLQIFFRHFRLFFRHFSILFFGHFEAFFRHFIIIPLLWTNFWSYNHNKGVCIMQSNQSPSPALENNFFPSRKQSPKGQGYALRPKGPGLWGIGSRGRGVSFPWVRKFLICEPL